MSRKLTIKEIRSVVGRYGKHFANGGRLTTYVCPSCNGDVLTEAPEAEQVGDKGYWDSMTTCMLCDGMAFVLVWPDGQTQAKAPGMQTQGKAANV